MERHAAIGTDHHGAIRIGVELVRVDGIAHRTQVGGAQAADGSPAGAHIP